MCLCAPAEVKRELARVRAGTQAFGGACSDRHLQGATGALLSGFSFFRLELGVPNPFFFSARCRQARQPAARAVRRISRRP